MAELNLLLDIARCSYFRACQASSGSDHACHDIVMSQGVPVARDSHLPEPWSGHIDRAPVLFLSSNPSIWLEERYPNAEWPDSMIADFFENRFDAGRPWVKDELRTLLREGDYAESPLRFWASARARASELLQRPAVPGDDYALSEVVHCKSQSETGVAKALMTCRQRFLRPVLEVSSARLIVVFGALAGDAARDELQLSGDKVSGPVEIGDRNRYFAFLPHPNARMRRTFASCMPEQLPRLREIIAAPANLG